MRNDIQIVADIIFDDDCLLYLCTPGMGVNLPKTRASPCLRAEALWGASARKGSEGWSVKHHWLEEAASNPLIKKGGYHD